MSKYVVESDRKHDDPDWLYEQYWEKGLTIPEIAEKTSYSQATISRRMEEHGIPRERGRSHDRKKHWDEEWLREKYWDEGLSTFEIASICGVDDEAVRQMMKRRGIERREPTFEWYDHVPLRMDGTGHLVWRHSHQKELDLVGVHRLVAIADGADPHRVFGEDTVVHHENNIPFDNRPPNLTLMDADEHIRHHGREYHE